MSEHWPDELLRAQRGAHLTTPPRAPAPSKHVGPALGDYMPDEAERSRRLRVQRDAGRPLNEDEIARRAARLRELAGHMPDCTGYHMSGQLCTLDVPDQPAPSKHVVMDPPVPLSPAWRLEHVEHGDDALARALRLAESGDNGAADTWARIASAHYAAANVRARALAPVLGDPPPLSFA